MRMIDMSDDDLKRIIDERVTLALVNHVPIVAEQNLLLRPKDAARELQVSIKTIGEWMRSGKLPYHRINTRIFIKREEMLAAMELSPKYKKTKK